MTSLVLASASPARRALLRSAGLEPVVQVSDVDEEAVLAAAGAAGQAPDPADAVLLLAHAKAQDVAARDLADLPGLPDADDALVVGCDSMLELDGEAYGKPADAADAVARWRRMRGRSGVLHTGHWLVDLRPVEDGGSGGTVGGVSSTVVHFADLADDEIAAYVATGEPLAVAGAFTVDGLGGPFVTRIEGDHHGVVGLSLPLLRELLAEVGVPLHTLWRR
ncbi:septum formation inhibitor Maf [Actinotalea ferrariae]|uniref:Maf family protein n=1 Tax=Actinotalea ferrariae TaxID=1386098 RepID=UPI001C8BA320|nr:Maf family protein [Actinotalea ferrariae]MBX9245965.1 septum formation inhibitor Maf [Actinotalea ferrariae]